MTNEQIKTKPYVGIKHNHEREIFRASDGPTRELYGSLYLYVIGPFRTVRGARFCQLYGRGNPHVQHVDDAERLARAQARKERAS